MLNQTIKTFYEKVVDRLIMQYEEYIFLTTTLTELENERFTQIAKIAKQENTSIAEITKNPSAHKSLKTIDEKIELYKTDLQRLSDEMTFANHYIWMMYKDKAYKGTSNEIATLGDFRRHCSPKGYICTQRFNFLSTYLQQGQKGINIKDINKYPDNMPFTDFYTAEEIVELIEDNHFLRQWKQQEYLIKDNAINKWGTK